MKILILGFSLTGKDVYHYLKDQHQVFIYDKVTLDHPSYLTKRAVLEHQQFDLIIRSPGIKSNHAFYRYLFLKAPLIISEIQLGLYLLKTKKIIMVSGTNGKTTLCQMLYHLLSTHFHVYLGGNIGKTLISQVASIKKDDVVIIEISSFQLENTLFFHSLFGILTTLSSNHLDSCFSKKYYYLSKLKLYHHSQYFLTRKMIKEKYHLTKALSYDHMQYYPYDFPTSFEREYAQICHFLGKYFNLEERNIIETISSFKKDHFRQEMLIIKDYLIINDSKATSLEASNNLLEQYLDQELILIMGGRLKSLPLSQLKIKPRMHLLVYGEARYLFNKQFSCSIFDTLEDIFIHLSQEKFLPKIILFTPGCSSLDQFTSYQERGKLFNVLVDRYL